MLLGKNYNYKEVALTMTASTVEHMWPESGRNNGLSYIKTNLTNVKASGLCV